MYNERGYIVLFYGDCGGGGRDVLWDKCFF